MTSGADNHIDDIDSEVGLMLPVIELPGDDLDAVHPYDAAERILAVAS